MNLQKLVQPSGTNQAVYPSKGSIQNVYAVYQRPATQIGIVQSDVLAFVTRVQSDPVLKRIAKKTRMVFPSTTKRFTCWAVAALSTSTISLTDGWPSAARAVARI